MKKSYSTLHPTPWKAFVEFEYLSEFKKEIETVLFSGSTGE